MHNNIDTVSGVCAHVVTSTAFAGLVNAFFIDREAGDNSLRDFDLRFNKVIFNYALKEKSGAETAPGWSRFHVHRMAPI